MRAWPLAGRMDPEMSDDGDGQEEGTWAGVEPETAGGGTSHGKGNVGSCEGKPLFPGCLPLLRATPSQDGSLL